MTISVITFWEAGPKGSCGELENLFSSSPYRQKKPAFHSTIFKDPFIPTSLLYFIAQSRA